MKPAFQRPVYAKDIAEAAYDARAIQNLKQEPLFPQWFASQVALQMAQNATDEDAARIGFDKKAVVEAVPAEQIKEITVQSYQAEVTEYEILRCMSGAPLGMEKGVFKIRFLVTRDSETFAKVAKAAGL